MTHQITARLAPDAKQAFDAYAAGVGLDSSELAKLLILREQKLKRLQTKQSQAAPERQQRGSAQKLPKVTAHLSSHDEVVAFDKHARTSGFTRARAAAFLLTWELQERWLEKALITP